MSWRKGVGGACARVGGPLQRSHVGDPCQPPEFGRKAANERVAVQKPAGRELVRAQGGCQQAKLVSPLKYRPA